MELESKIIVDVGVILISGIFFGHLAKLCKLPNVTGYMIAGLLLGPSVLNYLPADMVSDFSVVSDIALAFIAFSVGSEFSLDYFRKVGAAPIVIALMEGLGGSVFVAVPMILFGVDPKLSILLGAIAAATAPAQTIMVINQYRSKGSLTSMLLSVVALDDVVALVLFGFATTLVGMLETAQTGVILSILKPLYEVVISFVVGAAAALVMKWLFRTFKKKTNRLCIILGLVLLTFWGSEKLSGSALLACMSLGGVLVNITDEIDNVMETADGFTAPAFMIFFVISGAGFEISALWGIGLIGLMYVVLRVIGKWTGSFLGGKLMKQETKICRYLGPTLMPQAGVALGLLAVASSLIPTYAPEIRVIILCSTFIYSLIGPSAAKAALVKSGEIVIEEKHVGKKPEKKPA